MVGGWEMTVQRIPRHLKRRMAISRGGVVARALNNAIGCNLSFVRLAGIFPGNDISACAKFIILSVVGGEASLFSFFCYFCDAMGY